MQNYIIALISGLLFGLGLGVSQMMDRDRVLGFLDVMGDWDPALLFVLGGAVVTTVITFRFVLAKKHPLFAEKFYLPLSNAVDSKLIMGASLFGIGWGISGYCPGPGISALILGIWNPVIFLIAFFIGSISYGVISK